MTHQLWLPLIAKLPASWTESWISYMTPDWCWELLYEPFRKTGDTILTVSPGGIICWVTNAEAIYQIATRRESFPKPLSSYAILEIFGKNVLTTEGPEWRAHRKILSPALNERNNSMAFTEACAQAQGMLRKWTGDGVATINEVPKDTMRLALHIITRVGFGVRLLWPGEQPSEKQSVQDSAYSSNEAPEGHSMSFEKGLSTLLERLIWVLLTPKWLMQYLPFHGAKEGFEAWDNWRQYMKELFGQRVEEVREGRENEGMDIMGSLVKSSYGVTKRKASPGRAEKGEIGQPTLSDSDILGNAFVMIVAGHETSANSVHFTLMELAMSPASQRLVQDEITSVFGTTDPSTWTYDSSINVLLGGICGAVLNEQLRLMPPVINIPKSVPETCDQVITIDGEKITLPRGAHININTVGVQRNPRYWSTSPSKITPGANDLDDFKPERWLPQTSINLRRDDSPVDSSEDEFGGDTGRTTAPSLHRPPQGSYLPFSIGSRSCLGRRLAQVKIMAVMAVLFQTHSIELAVDEWATDAEVALMTDEQKRDLYATAQRKARETLRGASSLLTLKLHTGPGFVPVRVCRRGEERFLNLVDC
ncbi:cytochrome p450 3a21 [Phlyctema vagabunda]|uniref:Cytochrome p450 3a21 n=1 Tax=Phlyctema vagabunda TaxID=108571 RepID=A0ABR4PL32_9HELO